MKIGDTVYDIVAKTDDVRGLLQSNARMQVKIANNQRIVNTILNRSDLTEAHMTMISKYEKQVEDMIDFKINERVTLVKKLLSQSGMTKDKVEELYQEFYTDFVKDNAVEIALGLVDPKAIDRATALKN
ncbi:MAG: hypothetical protein B6V02_02010 [Thermoprotei archaeon ex4572_64]|nr:MAG: hypothetical protein B6V02_02010 [Thermoprotei archaeon ex4572_64]